MAKNYDKLITEVFEREKVWVHCEKHLYTGDPRNAPSGKGKNCPNCWKAFYIAMFAMASPESRPEQIDDLNAVGQIWAEQLEKGNVPAIPNARPIVNKKEQN